MFLCQALTAFNDNFYKNALTILIVYAFSNEMGIDPALLISAAAAAFILPFVLCSALAGQLADKYPKYKVVRVIKKFEMVLFLAAAIALYSDNPWLMMSVLFLLGLLAAFFGPTKYAILPELLKPEELLAGNGLVEAGTFLCILVGTLLGGLIILAPQGTHIVAVVLVVVGALGLWAAYHVPETVQHSPEVVPERNILASSWAMVRHARDDKRIFRSIIGISWFWAIGATYLTQIPIFTEKVVAGDEQVVTFFLALFSVGIAIGSVACHHLLHDEVTFEYAPYALFIMAFFGADVWWLAQHLPLHGEGYINLAQFFEYTAHWHLSIALLLMSMAGGVFIVPLYTSLQTFSDIKKRARTIASNNVINALFIALASLAAAGMYALEMGVSEVLVVMSLMNLLLIHMFLPSKHAV